MRGLATTGDLDPYRLRAEACRRATGRWRDLIDARAASPDRPHARRALRLGPGVLRAPPFRRGAVELGLTPARAAEQEALVAAVLRSPQAPCRAPFGEDLLRSIRSAGVGGAFWAPPPALPGGDGPIVWLRARTPRLAEAMLEHALADAPSTPVCIAAPSAAWARGLGGRTGDGRVHLSFGEANPWPALARAEALHAEGDDPLLLLALASGCPSFCWTGGIHTGWGLTRDRFDAALRRPVSLAELGGAVLVDATVYTDPFTGRPTSCEEAVATLADWKRVIDRRRGLAGLVGVRWWKRRALSGLLGELSSEPPLRHGAPIALAAAERRRGAAAVWAPKASRSLRRRAQALGTPLWSLEDGFLRSAGLGSDWTPPCSVVLDRSGPHYDPGSASELETLLQEAHFPPALLERADRLLDAVVGASLTKYNVGTQGRLDLPPGRRCVLVAGQVGDDASVLAGGGGRDVLDLLETARAMEPDAFILFKPHPDVEAGHRRGALDDRAVLRHADRMVRGRGAHSLLLQVEAVHTLTSLLGFEALLRRREVVVHGQPFYAGWGLTHDLRPPPRRTRRLVLAELVAGALILYPFYRDPVSGLPCPPEVLAGRLASQAGAATGPLVALRRLQGRTAAGLRRLDAELRRPGRTTRVLQTGAAGS